MHLWHRWRADLAQPEVPPGRDEIRFLLVAPVVIVALAQVTDPGGGWQVLLAVPAVMGFVLRALWPKLPSEAFALMVVVPVAVIVGQDGALEGLFLLSVTMVLYAAWGLQSITRALLITAVATAVPWIVSEYLVPEEDIGWNVWAMAHVFLFVLGRTMRRQREMIEDLETARRALADQAVAEERRRIARELHDLAGHTLAAVLLHVTGARHVLRRDQAEAERALREAESVGRSSLDQIRAAVAALRSDEKGTDPAVAGSRDLPALIEEYRRAGLTITADIADSVAGIEGPVGAAMHRIAREALANVARHAPRNRVQVQADTADGSVHLVIADRGAAGRAPDPHGLHFGLVGMAERARALGGDVEAGPTPDGWRVEARLPRAHATPEFAA